MEVKTLKEIRICEVSIYAYEKEVEMIQRTFKDAKGLPRVRMDALIDHIMNEDIPQCIARKEAILKALEQIEDKDTRAMIDCYIKGMTWNQISLKFYYSNESSVRSRVTRALKKIDFE